MCGFFFANMDMTLEGTDYVPFIKSILHTRGPDQGSEHYEKHFSAIFQRLAIQDESSAGMQPILDDGSMLMFNGEIYNKKALISTFYAESYELNDKADTILLSRLIKDKGFYEAIELIDGMFAIIYCDFHQSRILIARDAFGEKPIYYLKNEKRFFVASDLRCILPFSIEGINQDAVEFFIDNKFFPPGKTIKNDIMKLLPGEIITLEYDNLKEIRKTFITKSKEIKPKSSIRDQLMATVNSRMIGDRNVALLLSAGVDSNVIRKLSDETKHIQAYTIGSNDQQYDEAEEIKKHYPDAKIVKPPVYESITSLKEVILSMPCPSGDISYLMLKELCKNARADGYKVVLTGDGADEIFLGYNRHRYIYFVEKIPALFRGYLMKLVLLIAPIFVILRDLFSRESTGKPEILIDKIKRSFRSDNYNYTTFLQSSKIFNEEILFGTLKDLQKLDFDYFLAEQVLAKSDAASMSEGVEARSPYLSRELYYLAENYAIVENIGLTKGKKMLRRILRGKHTRYFSRRRKQGISLSLKSLLVPHLDELKDILQSNCIYSFNKNIPLDLLDPSNLNERNSQLLWNFIVLTVWVNEYENCSVSSVQ